jgi:hypothetical protein
LQNHLSFPKAKLIDKTLLFDGRSIGGLFWLVKKYFDRNILHLFYIEKQGLAMRQGKKDGAVAALSGMTNGFAIASNGIPFRRVRR